MIKAIRRTPEEARLLWCPFARVPDNSNPPGVTAVNRGVSGLPIGGSMCIADLCMAWAKDPDGQRGACAMMVVSD